MKKSSRRRKGKRAEEVTRTCGVKSQSERERDWSHYFTQFFYDSFTLLLFYFLPPLYLPLLASALLPLVLSFLSDDL